MSLFGIEGRVLDHTTDHEIEVQRSAGVVLLILRANPKDGTPQIWTIKERHTKPETDKLAGQLSVPAETRKIGEEIEQTTLAALSEYSGDSGEIDHLYIAGYIPGSVDVRESKADIAIMIYENENEGELRSPLDPDEVEPYGWISPNFLRTLNGQVRPLAHSAISIVSNETMRQLLQSHKDPSNRIPLRGFVGPEFSIVDFNNTRDLIPDSPLS